MGEVSRTLRRGSSDDAPTVLAVGALAATLAAVCHETVGHGLACVAEHAHVLLLTSIWFRCSGGAAVTAAGGPIGNLVAGTAAVTLLSCHAVSPRARLLLLMVGGLDLFWFAGQLAWGSLTNSDDWRYAALQMGWPGIWRPIAAAVGIGSYALLVRWLATITRRQGAPAGGAIRLAYAAAAISAVVAGLMWRPEPLRSALEGFLTLGIAPLGLLSAARRAAHPRHEVAADPIRRSWTWITVCAAIFGLFLLVQARGLGPGRQAPRQVTSSRAVPTPLLRWRGMLAASARATEAGRARRVLAGRADMPATGRAL